MKVKEFTLGVSYTYQPAAYHSIRGEASMTVDITEADDLQDVEETLRAALTGAVLANLAGMDEVHDKIYAEGLEPKQILADVGDSDDGWAEVVEDDEEEEVDDNWMD